MVYDDIGSRTKASVEVFEAHPHDYCSELNNKTME